jgi:hypothetical protein
MLLFSFKDVYIHADFTVCEYWKIINLDFSRTFLNIVAPGATFQNVPGHYRTFLKVIEPSETFWNFL